MGGSRLLELHNSSLSKLLSVVYPDHEWIPWKFQRILAKGWNNNAKKFMDYVAKELNISSATDWYKVTKEDIKKIEGGSRILSAHNNSLFNILLCAYPSNVWLPWEMPNAKISYWDSMEDWKLFLASVENKLNIKQPSDWLSITTEVT